MRGRRNRGRGRYPGRGREYKTSDVNTENKEAPSRLQDYVYDVGETTTSRDFTKVTEYLMTYIRKTYNQGARIAQSLEERKIVNEMMPKLQKSQSTDKDIADIENEEFKTLYVTLIKVYVDEQAKFRLQMEKTYGLLLSQCSETLQHKIKTTIDFDTKIKNKPIELLKAIEQFSLYSRTTRHPYDIVTESWINLISTKQQDHESILEYSQRFRSAKDLYEALAGEHQAPKTLVLQHPDYDKSDAKVINKCRAEVSERLLTFLYLKNADMNRFGTFMQELEAQQSLKNDQYPKTILSAQEILSERKWDKKYDENRHKNDSKRDERKQSPAETTTAAETPELSFQQLESNCWCCGQAGHRSFKCYHKDKIPRDKWAVSTVKAVQQLLSDRDGCSTIASGNQDSVAPSSSVKSEVTHDFTCLHQVCLHQADIPELRNWLLLDSASSVDLFCNPRFVTDIHPCGQTLSLASTGGMFTTNLKATVPGYGKVWYSDRAISNIFSLANMADKFRVVMDSEVSQAMIVKTPKRDMSFVRLHNNLFVYKPRKKSITGPHEVGSAYILTHVEPQYNPMCHTIAESKSFYSDRQLQRADVARNLMHSLAYPTVRDLKAVLKMNSIRNCPVTEKDVDMALRIYGPDLASLKGKTTRRKPTPVVEDLVSLPPELINAQRDVELSIDTMFVNGMAFLTTISSHIRYRTAQWVRNRMTVSYREQLEIVLAFYKRAGLRVTLICADQEFKATLEDMRDAHGFQPNYASAQEHVPAAERNNRVIEERVRAIFHGAPYKALPQVLLKYVVMECARRLNFFPAKGGCSDYYSPREILHHAKLDYEQQCKYPILCFVQAHDEPVPSNTLLPRSLDCIYLRPAANNMQGGHELYHLATKRVITRRNLTLLPVSPAVVAAVEAIAYAEGQTTLKFTSKGGHTISDSSLIAGVDTQISDNDDDAIGQQDPDPTEDEFNEEGVNDDTDGHTIDIAGVADDTDDAGLDDINPEYDPENEEPTVRRSDRLRNPPAAYEPSFQGQSYEPTVRAITYAQAVRRGMYPHVDQMREEYTTHEAQVLAHVISRLNEKTAMEDANQGLMLLNTYSLKKGLQQFGDKGKQATLKEMRQMHERRCFQPIHRHTLNPTERKRALESLIFLVEKRDGTIKARHCANGSTQRDYMYREEVSSPTVSTESVLLTAVLEAQEGRDVATCDIPNAFIQTDLQAQDVNGNRTIMKIRGTLVGILCEMDPLYTDYVITEGHQEVLYVHITKAIYGLLVSAMLFYRKLRGDLTEQGFEVNPYDPCVANKIVDGKQITVCWHVDDLKVSHMDPQVVDAFIIWAKNQYGSIGEVKVTRGKIHNYLGMTLDYSVPGQVSIDMTAYIRDMIQGFPNECLEGKKVASPWNENLFTVQDSPRLLNDRSARFHTVTAQGLFLCKRARPDISPAIAYLTTRVTCSTTSDWEKLTRMMKFLNQTVDDRLTLRADGSGKLHWHVDAAFAVHPDFRSHTGAVMSMGNGAIIAISRKQGMNTRSSTEAELVAADEVVGPMIWTKMFLQEQGYPVTDNVLYQDNKSAILLEQNGRQSAGKRSRHLNIRLFFVKDQVEKKNIVIEYCPTDDMTGDYMTKPLHGKKFELFRKQIMNLPMSTQMVMGACFRDSISRQTTVGLQECVGVGSNESSRLGESKESFSIDKLSGQANLNEQDLKKDMKIHGEPWVMVKAKQKKNYRLS